MGFAKLVENIFRRYLPSPFTIAVMLTLLTIMLAFIFTNNGSGDNHLFTILSYWESGIWNNNLLVFAYQMMLILVLGHVLVLSKPMERLILSITKHVKNTSNGAVLVATSTMLVSFFNWGLGLIFGAILARKVGEYAQAKRISINYPLIGASGYVGLMVWHGGISGSAPIKVSENGHLKGLLENTVSEGVLMQLPKSVSTALTVFSTSNLSIFFTVLLAISTLVYFLGKRVPSSKIELNQYKFQSSQKENLIGAEKLDYSRSFSILFGLLILAVFLIQYLT